MQYAPDDKEGIRRAVAKAICCGPECVRPSDCWAVKSGTASGGRHSKLASADAAIAAIPPPPRPTALIESLKAALTWALPLAQSKIVGLYQDEVDAEKKAIATLEEANAYPPAEPAWTCAARQQSLPEPADCNWPVCGCDPYANKVIEALHEASGS